MLALAVGSSAPAWAASSPTGNGRVTFGIVPAQANGEAIRSNFTIGATPGGVVFDQVAALNFSAVPLSLLVSATDAIESTGGGFGLLPPNVTPTKAGSWITIPPQFTSVTVPPGTSKAPGHVLVPLTIHVPFNTSPGDHVAGIVVTLQTKGVNRTGQAVILDQRVGTRVYIQVAGPLSAKLSVTGLHSSYVGTPNPVGRGNVETSYVLTNTGNVDLAVDQTLTVTGLLGSKEVVTAPKVALLLPGSSVAEQVAVPGVWPQLLAQEVVTAKPTVLASGQQLHAVNATASVGIWTIPWTLIILIIVLLGAIYLYRRRRSRRSPNLPTGPTSSSNRLPAAIERPQVSA
jgi:hypothetical protein